MHQVRRCVIELLFSFLVYLSRSLRSSQFSSMPRRRNSKKVSPNTEPSLFDPVYSGQQQSAAVNSSQHPPEPSCPGSNSSLGPKSSLRSSRSIFISTAGHRACTREMRWNRVPCCGRRGLMHHFLVSHFLILFGCWPFAVCIYSSASCVSSNTRSNTRQRVRSLNKKMIIIPLAISPRANSSSSCIGFRKTFPLYSLLIIYRISSHGQIKYKSIDSIGYYILSSQLHSKWNHWETEREHCYL